MTFALAALAIAVFAVIAGRPEANGEPPGAGYGAPVQIIPAGSTPASDGSGIGDGNAPQPASTPHQGSAAFGEIAPLSIAGPDCSIDLDVSLETERDSVHVPVRARAKGGCRDIGTLHLAIVDASGRRPDVSGNPLTVSLKPNGRERRADIIVAWNNWCGVHERFGLETTFGDEQQVLALPKTPSCLDVTSPSTVHAIEEGVPPGTPVASPASSPPTP